MISYIFWFLISSACFPPVHISSFPPCFSFVFLVSWLFSSGLVLVMCAFHKCRSTHFCLYHLCYRYMRPKYSDHRLWLTFLYKPDSYRSGQCGSPRLCGIWLRTGRNTVVHQFQGKTVHDLELRSVWILSCLLDEANRALLDQDYCNRILSLIASCTCCIVPRRRLHSSICWLDCLWFHLKLEVVEHRKDPGLPWFLLWIDSCHIASPCLRPWWTEYRIHLPRAWHIPINN